MRYAKGSIQLSQAHDYPLLRQVLRSEFALHRQLYEFLELSHYEWSRQSFAWRARRLLRHGLLVAQHLAPFGGDLAYSVTPLVAQHLQVNGESCLFSVNRPRPNPVGCLHAVELNEIHLSLLRSGVQASWTYATEVRCQNELSGFGYVKDYDAIVRLGSNGSETRGRFRSSSRCHVSLGATRLKDLFQLIEPNCRLPCLSPRHRRVECRQDFKIHR